MPWDILTFSVGSNWIWMNFLAPGASAFFSLLSNLLSVKCFALVLLSSLIFSVSSCWAGNVVDLAHRTRWLVHGKLCALLVISLAVNADHKNSEFCPVSISVIDHSEVMSRGVRFPAPWLRGRASSSSHGGERGRGAASVCESESGGKHRWSRCWEVHRGGSALLPHHVAHFHFLFFDCYYRFSGVLAWACVTTRRRPRRQVGGLPETRQARWKSKTVPNIRHVEQLQMYILYIYIFWIFKVI